jgi:hypothetical protein
VPVSAGEVPVPGAVVAPGTVAPGAGVLGAGAAAVGVTAVGVLVTVVTAGLVVECAEPPASVTSAAASTPIESMARTAIARIGAFHAGDAAKRVRAAAPQCRHHSCSGLSGVPHSGHVSPMEGEGAAVPGGGGAATLTRLS